MGKESEIAAGRRMLNVIRNDGHLETGAKDKPAEGRELSEIYKKSGNTPPYQQQSILYKLPPPGWLHFGRTYIGLDEGTYAIKMVGVKKRGGIYNLLSFALIETLPVAQYENKNAHAAQVLEGIKRAISNNGHGRSKIYTAIGGPRVMVRRLSMPQMSPKELESSVKWEARKYMPYNADEMELDYQILSGNPQTAKMDVLLAAAPRELIKRKLDIMQQLQIHSTATDVNPLAVINAFILSGEYRAGERVIILDIGSATAYLNIYREGGEYFVRNIPIAGEHFTREIMQKLKLDYLRAESIKREAEEIIPLLADPLRAMVMEIRRTLTFYRNQAGANDFDRLVVTGGNAYLKGFTNYLQNELKIEVNIFDPLSLLHINDPEAVKLLQPFASQLTTAIGLVVRGK